LRAAVPGPSSAREHGKDQCRAVPARRCNYTTSALSPSNRELKESKRGEMRLWCGRNCISPDDRREEPRSGRYAGCRFAAGKRSARSAAPTRTARHICRVGKRAPRRCAPINAAAGYSESGMRQAPKRRTSMWPPSTLTTVDGTPPGLMPSSTTMSAERPTSASACGASVAAR